MGRGGPTHLPGRASMFSTYYHARLCTAALIALLLAASCESGGGPDPDPGPGPGDNTAASMTTRINDYRNQINPGSQLEVDATLAGIAQTQAEYNADNGIN